MHTKQLALALLALLSSWRCGAVPEAAAGDPAGEPFSWSNALVYYVDIDRFSNGSRSNDLALGRQESDSFGLSAGTFHGGDLAGLRMRLDYIASLGASAVMISSPVEQVHGVFPGAMGLYGAYGYDGTRALDYTYIDPSFGTVNEMRRFVQQAHESGLRVVMSLQLCFPGPPTLRDMCEFGFGKTVLGWEECIPWQPGIGESYDDMPVDLSEDPSWNRWWGPKWIRAGIYGEPCADASCMGAGMRFKNLEALGERVSVPGFLAYKWDKYANPEYAVPAASKYRGGSGTVAYFQTMWAASWVREFGLDGIALDDALMLSPDMLMMLERNCSMALEDWRKLEREGGGDPASRWSAPFMLIGVQGAGPHKSSGGAGNEARMAALGAIAAPPPDPQGSSGKCSAGGGDGPEGGTLRRGTLLIHSISWLGRGLCRGVPAELAGSLLLRRGPVLAVYGDETGRKGGAAGDFTFAPKVSMDSDMNFPRDVDRARQWAADRFSFSYTLSSDPGLSAWQRIGQFRLRNIAVGGGRSEFTKSGAECRIFESGGYRNAVVLYQGNAAEIEVGRCFGDGEILRDAATGRNMTVSGGRVLLSGGGLHLIERYRRPSVPKPILD
ncbi:MAG: alpha-amylase family glycosyl hydrolase [Succinivibrio sp.]